MKKTEQGFTLIEIIAVLILLGILSAVAVPKFMDLRDEARIKGLEGLVSAGQSQLHLAYAENLLVKNGYPGAAWTATQGNASTICGNVSTDGWLNDATLTCTSGTSGDLITISAKYNSLTATGNFTDPDS